MGGFSLPAWSPLAVLRQPESRCRDGELPLLSWAEPSPWAACPELSRNGSGALLTLGTVAGREGKGKGHVFEQEFLPALWTSKSPWLLLLWHGLPALVWGAGRKAGCRECSHPGPCFHAPLCKILLCKRHFRELNDGYILYCTSAQQWSLTSLHRVWHSHSTGLLDQQLNEKSTFMLGIWQT